MLSLRPPIRRPCRSTTAAVVPWLTTSLRRLSHQPLGGNTTNPPGPDQPVSAIVVGGGAAGIATVGNLLDVLGDRRVAWIDPAFGGGRINARWREVPSNTTVRLFREYGHALASFRRVAETTPAPNALTTLESLDPGATCSLHHAGDMLQMLSDGLRRDGRVAGWEGAAVRTARADDASSSSGWTVTIRGNRPSTSGSLTAPLVVFCTGASPTTAELPTAGSAAAPKPLSLEVALKPSVLESSLPRDGDVCVGVVGASHSAILALKNLFELSRTTHPRLRVRWFARTASLKYAEPKDGWILYDNTGLKGTAAEFGRACLDGARLGASGAGAVITRVDCAGGPEKERTAFLRHLPECDYVVQAIGFTRDALPAMEGTDDVGYDDATGGLVRRATGEPLPGLFGAGIAFPERVTDPLGNVEHAVGFFKFMRYLKRVVPEWVKSSIEK